MPPLKALLVHSSSEVRTALREYLADVDFLQVLGEAVSAFEAMELLESVPYGVFFIGVELEGEADGLELAGMLAGRRNGPATVFIASDESKAFSAFELGATDYLLWPFDRERLARTLERLRQFKAHFKLVPMPTGAWKEDGDPSSSDPLGPPNSGEKHGDEGEQMLKVPMGEEEEDKFLQALRKAWDESRRQKRVEIEKLPINMDGRTMLVPYDRIIFVEAYEDYSYVHTANQKYLTSYRLKALEDRLRHHRFFRVHRKYLVNLDMVNEIASLPGSNFMLRTTGKTRIELPVSRRRIAELKQILHL